MRSVHLMAANSEAQKSIGIKFTETRRSSSQIYNVTLFFIFFMSLYGIMGVQFFGELSNHCVINASMNPSQPLVDDLMIPDTYCTKHDKGYKCPEGTVCKHIRVSRKERSYNGFDEIATSMFTVYEAASQEGWVFHMYRAIDSLSQALPLFFFITMIFFLAWLVKNVFIAVINETFAEIRVQFQQMWGARVSAVDIEPAKLLVRTDDGLKLLDVDDEVQTNVIRFYLNRVLTSSIFNVFLICTILANAIIIATISFTHDKAIDFRQRNIYRKIEIAFTIVFNIEACLKMFCFGFKNYLKRSMYKFELALCIGTSLHCFDFFYRGLFTSFQVLRLVRLLKTSPILEDFANKVFGPGKKLGSLIIFTGILLLITSAVSMQLFSFIKGLERFETFPKAFMAMFQVLTQKGWVDIMHTTMKRSGNLSIATASYFVFFHLFFSLIVLSMFVAVILDNLELDEDVKKIKQLKMREQSAEATQKLPLRLRIFENFADRPQLVVFSKAPEEFTTPKIRESFMRRFVDQGDSFTLAIETGFLPATALTSSKLLKASNILCKPERKRLGDNVKRIALSNIVGFSHSMKSLLWDGINSINSKSQWFQQKSNISGMGEVKRDVTFSNFKSIPAIHDTSNIVSAVTSAARQHDEYDIKAFQYKKQQAEFKRNQQEETLRENHPFFDTPLFLIKRDSRFRHFCKTIVEARYIPETKDPVTGQDIKLRYKPLHNLLGLVSYLEWIMILVTVMSCLSMMVEAPYKRVFQESLLQIAEFTFVICMSVEIMLKIFANGVVITPKAMIRDFGGLLDLFTFVVSLTFLCWLPEEIPVNSAKWILLILRCLRPLRIFVLVPDLRKVVFELLRGSKEIILVAILLVSVLFIFAIFAVQILGGKLARCNDQTISNQEDCIGVYWREIEVTKLEIKGDNPKILVPRIWANPHNFDFDSIGNAMLALFEVLSLEGWLEIRDVVLSQLGGVSI
ncbi:hypothetical protein GJ496_009401 [Pomphorhynchus laevis]|nr:hypothetical protein GJ496_009401 [Pomphorhynchus laevis]